MSGDAISKNLLQALLQLENEKELAAFLRDLLTPAEIEEMGLRLAVAQQLNNGSTQREAAKVTGASIATVTRVNQWLTRGMGGYKLVLERLYNHRHQRH